MGVSPLWAAPLGVRISTSISKPSQSLCCDGRGDHQRITNQWVSESGSEFRTGAIGNLSGVGTQEKLRLGRVGRRERSEQSHELRPGEMDQRKCPKGRPYSPDSLTRGSGTSTCC